MEQKKSNKKNDDSTIENIETELKTLKSKSLNKVSFESALQELDVILSKLEKGNLNLEKTTKLYEQGAELLKICNKEFNKASGTVAIIKNNIEEIFKE